MRKPLLLKLGRRCVRDAAIGVALLMLGNNSVTRHAAGSNGDAKPLAPIISWKTVLREPSGIAIGP